MLLILFLLHYDLLSKVHTRVVATINTIVVVIISISWCVGLLRSHVVKDNFSRTLLLIFKEDFNLLLWLMLVFRLW